MKNFRILSLMLLFVLNCAPRDNYLKKMAQAGEINRDAARVSTASININVPAQQVFDIVTNVSKWPSWNPRITAVKASGITFLGDIFVWKLGKNVHSTVMNFDKNKKIVIFSTSLSYRSIIEWKFEEISANETRVTLSESRDGFFMNFFSKKEHYEILADWLSNLKNRSEVVIM